MRTTYKHSFPDSYYTTTREDKGKVGERKKPHGRAGKVRDITWSSPLTDLHHQSTSFCLK